jgi:hypothetical protein
MWWDSSSANLYIYYDNFWVEAVVGAVGPQGPTGDQAFHPFLVAG